MHYLHIAQSLVALGLLSLANTAPTEGQSYEIINDERPGPYPVSISTHELRTDRNDTIAPTPQKRRVMLEVFYPDISKRNRQCSTPQLIPYFPEITLDLYEPLFETAYGLPLGTVDKLRIQSCARASTNARTATPPLLLFSHGGGATRLIYQTILTAIASAGYTIVSIDHTYDATGVEFPDGTLALTNWPEGWGNGTDAQIGDIIDYYIPPRVADASDVLDALEAGSIPGLEGYKKKGNKRIQAGFFGQSLGGGTAIFAAAKDDRITGAFNWDGRLAPDTMNIAVEKPVLLLGSAMMNQEPILNATWGPAYENFESWKGWFVVKDSAHASFSDFPVIIDELGIRDDIPKFEDVLATISGERLLKILYYYTVAFFDLVTKNKRPDILRGPSLEFPEVDWVRLDEN